MDPKVEEKTSEGGDQQRPSPSTFDLLSSAKVVAGAAQASLGNKSEEVNKGKVAGAAADLLDAAGQYGKLDEKSFGGYYKKAETYLHDYEASYTSTTTATTTAPVESTPSPDKPPVSDIAEEHGGKKGEGGGYGSLLSAAGQALGSDKGEEHGGKKEAGGGYGDLMSAAGQVLGSDKGEEHGGKKEEGGGFGGFMSKAAGSFLK